MKLPFGKFEGDHVENVPMSYLWSLWEDDILKPGPLKEAVRQRIEPERYDFRMSADRGCSMNELRLLAAKILAKHEGREEDRERALDEEMDTRIKLENT